MIHYHGTTLKNARKMIEGNFNPDSKPSGTWNCSDDSFLYLYSSKKSEFSEEEDEAVIEFRTVEQAFESAEITAALTNSLERTLVVFAFEFPDDLKEFIEDDYSAENMSNIADVINLHYVKKEHIVRTFVCENGYEPMYRIFVLSGLFNGLTRNQYLNTSYLSGREEECIEAIADVDFYIEPGFEYETLQGFPRL